MFGCDSAGWLTGGGFFDFFFLGEGFIELLEGEFGFAVVVSAEVD